MPNTELRDRIVAIVERAVLGRTAIRGAHIAADAILPLVEEAVNAERERCARIAESRHDVGWPERGAPLMTARYPTDGLQIAAAIRTPEPTKEER